MLQIKYGWDFKHDLIGKFRANSPMRSGTVVQRVEGADGSMDNVGPLADSDSKEKYLLLQDVDLTGPTFQEIVVGVINYNVAVGSPVTVALWIPNGIIETDNVDKGLAGEIAVGDLFTITDGVFTLDENGADAICTDIIDATAGIYELKLL